MQLESIDILNIRGLGVGEPLRLDLCPDGRPAPQWVAVVGPNGAGKSTLLATIALGLAGAETCTRAGRPAAWWRSKEPVPWRVEGADGRVDTDLGAWVRVRCRVGEHDAWSLDADTKVPDAALPLYLRVWVPRDRHEGFEHNANPKSAPFFAGPWSPAEQRRGWFVAGYGPYRRLSRGSRDAESIRDMAGRAEAQLMPLFREDVALIQPLDWLEGLDYRRLKGGHDDDAVRLLPKILDLLSDGLLRGPSGAIAKIVEVTPDGLLIHENGVSLVLSDLSDGYQTVVGLILDLVHQFEQSHHGVDIARDDTGRHVVRNEGVVLIDELESHLHPAWQRTIGQWLIERFPNVQFIVATHSPFVCQSAARDGVIVRLARPDEPAGSRVLTDAELGHLLNGTADDIYLSGLFGIDAVRSVEAQAELERATVLEGRIRRGLASAEDKAEYQRLVAAMPPSSEVVRALGAVEQFE